MFRCEGCLLPPCNGGSHDSDLTVPDVPNDAESAVYKRRAALQAQRAITTGYLDMFEGLEGAE